MIRLACLFATILSLAGCDFGSPQRLDWPAPSPVLWELSNAQGAKGWLFGTVHALPDGLEWRTEKLDTAIAQSNVLVVEIANLGATKAAASHFRRLGTTLAMPPLLQRVPEAGRGTVARLLERAGMDEDDFGDLETWAAALILADAVKQYSPANGVDRTLLEQADGVAALESYQAQFSVFDTLAEEDQAQLLVSVAEEAEAAQQDSQIAAWLTGDLAALEQSATKGLLSDPELREALLAARNRAWADRIVRLVHEGKRPFVAVGAAHMLTQDGLPTMLEARGLTMERLQ